MNPLKMIKNLKPVKGSTTVMPVKQNNHYSSKSPHNKDVKATLFKELKNDPENAFSDDTISCWLQ